MAAKCGSRTGIPGYGTSGPPGSWPPPGIQAGPGPTLDNVRPGDFAKAVPGSCEPATAIDTPAAPPLDITAVETWPSG